MPLYGYINHEIKEEILTVLNFLSGFWVVTLIRYNMLSNSKEMQLI